MSTFTKKNLEAGYATVDAGNVYQFGGRTALSREQVEQIARKNGYVFDEEDQKPELPKAGVSKGASAKSGKDGKDGKDQKPEPPKAEPQITPPTTPQTGETQLTPGPDTVSVSNQSPTSEQGGEESMKEKESESKTESTPEKKD
jgi:hypothetical protein